MWGQLSNRKRKEKEPQMSEISKKVVVELLGNPSQPELSNTRGDVPIAARSFKNGSFLNPIL